ncbi:hypothetical protein HUJ05_003071 [Dendroctonus ponderosae]|nr:hypothetical protein HUJ05_003071 [Dendroctonus ponderosae]
MSWAKRAKRAQRSSSVSQQVDLVEHCFICFLVPSCRITTSITLICRILLMIFIHNESFKCAWLRPALALTPRLASSAD